MSTAKAMSKLVPVVIVDSSDSERDGSASKRASSNSERDGSASKRASILPVVSSASVNNVASRWTPGTQIRNGEDLHRFLLASSSSETDTDSGLDFSTPPFKTGVKANWEIPNKTTGENEPKKMGEDVNFATNSSPPYDPSGLNSDEEEKKKQEQEDHQFAVYLDMDLNGRPMKAAAKKRIGEIAEEENNEPLKKKDRSAYWKQRHLKERNKKILRQTPHFNLCLYVVQESFCGLANLNRTFKQGTHNIAYKRAVIPNSSGTIQHDLIVSSGEFFHRILNDVAVQILPSENGTLTLDNNREVDAHLIFAETFPPGVFPAFPR